MEKHSVLIYTPESSLGGLYNSLYVSHTAQLSYHDCVTPTLFGISSIRSTNCNTNPSD